MPEEKELEQAVGEVRLKIKGIHGNTKVADGLRVSELQSTVESTMEFINFIKFNMGEDITSPEVSM